MFYIHFKFIATAFSLFSYQVLLAQIALNANNFNLIGNVIGSKTDQIVMSYVAELGDYRHDTTKVLNGLFKFTGIIKGPTQASIKGNINSRGVSDPNYIEIYLELGNLAIVLRTDFFKEAKLTGSKTQLELEAFKAQTKYI